MKYIRVNLFLFTLLSITSLNAQKKQVFNLNETQLIKDSFVSLNDNILDSNDSLNELTKLYKLSEDKSFVSIGEATHGTEEIKKLQIILSKGLILNSKFQTIALAETNLLASYDIFDFVVNNHGNLGTISNKRNFDISNLIKWLNNYNSNKPFKQKIWLIGTDVDSPEEIIDFIEVHCKSYKIENISTTIDNLRGIFDKNNTNIFANNDTLISNKNRLISILSTAIGKSDSLDFKIDCMVRSLNSLIDILKNTNNSLANFQKRDYLIFKNLEWLNNLKGKTVIINAHNLHINKIAITPEIYTNSSKPFGKYLSEKYNQDYLSIATEVDKGFFYNGSSPKTAIIEDKKKFGTILGSISSSNYGYLVFNQKLKNILNSYNLKITKGTSMSYLIDCNKNLGDAFDVLIFIKSSNPYTFNNKEDFYNLYFNLDEKLFSNILSDERMTLTSTFEPKNINSDTAIMYSIFLNDVNKKVIFHYQPFLKESGQEFTFNVPPQTKYLSINMTFRKQDYFKLTQFKINNQIQKLNDFTFFDWNNVGYVYKIVNHNIVITKPTTQK